jgi:transcriptional regulator with XRE-family HTH domain
MTPEQMRRVSTMRELAACGAARALRKKRRLSLRELAGTLGTSPSTLSRWETGDARPRPVSALKWADTLGVAA